MSKYWFPLFLVLVLANIFCGDSNMPDSADLILKNKSEIEGIPVETSQFRFSKDNRELLVLRRVYQFDNETLALAGFLKFSPERPLKKGTSESGGRFAQTQNAFWLLHKSELVYLHVLRDESKEDTLTEQEVKTRNSLIADLFNSVLGSYQN